MKRLTIRAVAILIVFSIDGQPCDYIGSLGQRLTEVRLIRINQRLLLDIGNCRALDAFQRQPANGAPLCGGGSGGENFSQTAGTLTKSELYRRAKKRGKEGRSKMTKRQLKNALH
jgi:hypothetical protein